MSMGFSEFKKHIIADPWSQDPAIVRARESDPRFEQAALEAQSLNKKLESAVSIPAPEGLLEDIKTIVHSPTSQRRWLPWAMAASILIAIGAFSIGWKQTHQWDSVEDYLVDHYSHDGERLMGEATGPVSAAEVEQIMASLNATAGQSLTGMVKLIKYCPTPDGRGAHLVVSTDDGPMTIVFMPKTRVTDGEILEFDQKHAYMVNLDHGSAAIIGRSEQPVGKLQTLVRNSITSTLSESQANDT